MCAENVKRIQIKIAFVTIPVLLLAATVAISIIVPEDAFAKDGRYSGDTSQAASVSNECLNPIFDSNEDIDNAVDVGNCAGTVSQQDESGSASAPITQQTADPTIELQRSTTQPPLTGNPPETCEECFDVLTDDQQLAFEGALSSITSPSPHLRVMERYPQSRNCVSNGKRSRRNRERLLILISLGFLQ